MSNYTAGPWQLQNPEGLLSVQVVKQPDKCICTVYKLFFEDAEALANARLMAAAPDLLEALDKLLAATVDEDLKYGITLTEAEEEARALALAAIAKTVGEDDDQ